MRRWDGDDMFVVIRGNLQTVHEVEIKTGSLFWLPSSGGVLIDTIITDLIDPRLLPYSTVVGWVTRDQYKLTVKEKRIAECPANVETIVTTNAPAHLAPLIKMGVRFS